MRVLCLSPAFTVLDTFVQMSADALRRQQQQQARGDTRKHHADSTTPPAVL
jgi:hypothetical protein